MKNTLSTILPAPAIMHFICFNQQVASIPLNHLKVCNLFWNFNSSIWEIIWFIKNIPVLIDRWKT